MSQVVLFGDSPHFTGRPLSIYLLASHLRKHDISVQPIWAWNYVDDLTFKNLCLRYISDETLVVGISSTLLIQIDNKAFPMSDFFGIPTEKFRQRIELVRSLAHPDCKIVVGGSQVTHASIAVLPEKDVVDIFVQGQGEEVLLEIIESIKNNTRIQSASIAPIVTSDKIYPYNTFATDYPQIIPSDCVLPREAMAIEFARGCIFRCSFCNYQLNGKKPGDYIKSKDTLRSELIRNYEMYGIRHYWSTDDLINDSEEKVDQILEVSQSLPFKIQYTGYVRLDLIRKFPSMAEKLRESGLIGAFIGLETINDASGKAVGKGLGKERTTEAIELCRDAWHQKVLVNAGFILGLPKDTPDTKYELIDWLNLPAIRDVITDISVQQLYIRLNAPDGSDMDKDPAKFGYDCSEEVKFANTNTGRRRANWRTEYYDYQSAIKDSIWVAKEFYKKHKYSKRIDTFTLPYIMSLSKQRQDVLDLLLTDTSRVWKTNENWQQYVYTLISNHRKKSINELLRGKI